MEEKVKKYCEVVKKSSNENKESINILFEKQLYKNCMAILRQELELYTKTLFLITLEPSQRDVFMNDFLENKPWRKEKINGKNVTDRFILNQIQKSKINSGWEAVSYKFGCSFIHLSIFHDLEDKNILSHIEDKVNIVYYINQYHHGHLNIEFDFNDIKPYILDIFNKIKDNMESYLNELSEKA